MPEITLKSGDFDWPVSTSCVATTTGNYGIFFSWSGAIRAWHD